MAAPHETGGHEITVRRGQFWVPGERVEAPQGTVQRGPMFVSWEAPLEVTHPYPLVLVHGGGGQRTDWTGTPDGRPGWATRFVEAGFAVYVVDRCGHGRSPYHPDVIGPMGAQIPYEAVENLFASENTTWDYDQLTAAMGPLPADLALSQRLDADRLARLLDRTGPAVLVTHSAGGPVGWLATDARPDLVVAIAAIEPMGPPFVDFPGMGPLTWGLTSAEITYDPPAATPEEVPGRRIPALAGKPVVVVTGGASAFAGFAQEMVEFLTTAGAHAERLHLPDHGITGNGHGLVFETNSDEAVKPVIEWISKREAA
ncbi:Lysophospholipase, alpha-beta hydrolase superfamily [Amycolatopsis sacchari]|uniref:Lysophospholipase, alpha-beta hydrolase superfamily n=1 Tax=Amycolatopsis sacchari TaxID=115433 RepID=A0A1I3QX60_9PSEU|nr:alpha/beta fold hydrolase [Amycolatopsis sacchari]SFJ38320.1 Lysophospholipase, alpha-beta hydrolase superfamily [Amycolatopsis sacchari]